LTNKPALTGAAFVPKRAALKNFTREPRELINFSTSMILTALKNSLSRLVPGATAIVLCIWAVASRPLSRAPEKGTRSTAPRDVANPPRPTSLLLHDDSASPANVRPHLSAIDGALGRLEYDLRRATEIADARERRDVLTSACLTWADFDPADALRMARTLGLDRTEDAVLDDIVQKWATTDFHAALAWTNREPSGELRDRLLTRLVFIRSQTEPNEAAVLAVMRISPGPTQVEAIISVLHQWALRDLAPARTWAERLPVEMRERALTELATVAKHRLTLNATAE
jgi:hypothetical protein